MTLTAAVSRRDERRDERRDAILDVARDCFLSLGYAATSMSAIAARLGGSKGTLYNYFKNKEDLFAAMMERQCGALQAQLFETPSAGREPRDFLGHYGRSFLTILMAPQQMAIYRVVIAESERFPELGRAFFESGPRVVMARMADYLTELMDRGVLRQADPLIAAQHFKDLTMSGAYNKRLWNVIDDLTPAEMDAQISCAVDTFMRAYAP